MSDLNILLKSMNQRSSTRSAARLEGAATSTLLGMLALMTVALLF